MKKIINTLFLLSTVLTLSFAAPKKTKSNSIKLDAKNNFAIEGMDLGRLEWTRRYASLSNKGEIIWKYDTGQDWLHYGWELRGTDMSQYAGLKIEFAAKEKLDIRLIVKNPAADGEWAFQNMDGNVIYAMFTGVGKWYGDMKNPDPTKGYEIYFLTEAKNKYSKTAIKNIELLSKEDYPDTPYLDLLGVNFGSSTWQTRVIGNEITWPKGYHDGNAGWNLEGIDLSEYDRIRIEVESNDVPGLEISMTEKDGKNYHSFNQQLEPGLFEADLSGEGYSWINDDGTELHKSEGLNICLHYWNEKPSKKDYHTVVKSVQLLKGKRISNENLQIEGKTLGSTGWNSKVYDGGIIEWEWNGKEKYPCSGWRVEDVDFSNWKAIELELSPEAVTKKITLSLYQKATDAGVQFNANSKTVIKANFDGADCDFEWENNGKWDPSLGIDEIWIRYDNLSKSGEKTIVKSVKLLAEDTSVPQPETLILSGAKLGSKKDSNSWIDENFAINWNKSNYIECGWKVEKLEGDILEIKVTSTDTPLHLKIRDNKKNEAEWEDDGSHLFRIDLKTKKMLRTNGSKKEPMWTNQTKTFDFSEGGEIIFVPANGVFKEGKKTVVEYIKIEK